jgi:NAD+ synthase
MSHLLTIALAQCNFTVGDIAGNTAKILQHYNTTSQQKADLVVFSELAITGYPPEDLVLRPGFVRAAMAALEPLAEATRNSPCAMLVGGIIMEDERLYNTAFFIRKGAVETVIKKTALPNYGVFDEVRIFSSATSTKPVTLKGVKLGIMICEDIWQEGAIASLAKQGATLFVALNASPFNKGKHTERLNLVTRHVHEYGAPFIYVNQVGGQDELVFDGGSFIMAKDGEVTMQLPWWQESLAFSSFSGTTEALLPEPTFIVPPLSEHASIYQAMMLGLKDYVTKNNFPGVLIGLSGGIDSALTAAVAVDALGSSKVHCVMLPSRYTSEESLSDAEECAELLGVRLDNISIETLYGGAMESLKPIFKGTTPDLTEENLQSRIRGLLLMALSNKFGKMVLTTGNKSEMAVGYATIYGDMCGGFNILKDIYKSEVWALARWRNRNFPDQALGEKGTVIPDSIIVRPPTAELRENQLDQDNLPNYEFLDDILYKLIEQQLPVEAIVKAGYDKATVEKVVRLLYMSEYKRRQAAPGVKISTLSFGRERRYPLTSKYRG